MIILSESDRKYLDSVYRFLTIRNRSEKEVRDYLQKKQAQQEIIEQIISFLTEKKFLDDKAFAKAWISSRARAHPRGKFVLIIELQRKGISKELITQVFEELEEELPDDLTQAKRLITSRMKKMQGKPRQEMYQKVGSFLSRKGFSWDISKKAIDELLQLQ